MYARGVSSVLAGGARDDVGVAAAAPRRAVMTTFRNICERRQKLSQLVYVFFLFLMWIGFDALSSTGTLSEWSTHLRGDALHRRGRWEQLLVAFIEMTKVAE